MSDTFLDLIITNSFIIQIQSFWAANRAQHIINCVRSNPLHVVSHAQHTHPHQSTHRRPTKTFVRNEMATNIFRTYFRSKYAHKNIANNFFPKWCRKWNFSCSVRLSGLVYEIIKFNEKCQPAMFLHRFAFKPNRTVSK